MASTLGATRATGGREKPRTPRPQCGGERTRAELAILEAAADIHRRFGREAIPHYVISKCQSVSDLLEHVPE